MPTGTAGSTQNRDVTKSRSDAGEDMMTLFVWGSGWGLPSIDTNSLQIMVSLLYSPPVSVLDLFFWDGITLWKEYNSFYRRTSSLAVPRSL